MSWEWFFFWLDSRLHPLSQTFQSHSDASGTPGHAARRLSLWRFSAQHPFNVAHAVTVDGVCGQTQTGRGVNFGNVHLQWRENIGNCRIQVKKKIMVCIISHTQHQWKQKVIIETYMYLIFKNKQKKSVLIHATLNNDLIGVKKTATHLESLADSWIQHEPVHPPIHPDSTNKQLLLFDLLVAHRQSNGSNQDSNSLQFFFGGQRANHVLTSLNTRKSATVTTTLTRWSSRCADRLRESREWASDQKRTEAGHGFKKKLEILYLLPC